jgi:hypothetical protein
MAVAERAERGRFESTEVWGALLGGGMAALALFGLIVGVGQVGSFEALRLIEAVMPAARFLATAVATASITVLALLLTLLGLSLTSEYTFRTKFYSRVGHITTLSVSAIIVAVAMLLAASVPIEQVQSLSGFYDVYYYVVAAGISILGGVTIAIGLMIGSTLRGLVRIGRPDSPSDLLYDPEELDSSDDDDQCSGQGTNA